ncbi:hypothetical protein FPOAC2_00887 [Fusarium poae]|uniref:C2H2-type domain-containing protein n=1 Tax=Fusarium poae TaxID=36050 RepID=A0A1B8B2Z9_FUSPO|nr:hypothetical protein FPOAC1_000822 [Fusarium poae]KAG8674850.1 hypothetical protein FPOAC1_000822 [Fusarium poae]OBS27093.1 hypothetical protein FPOA_01034 [Fusarium poae]
MPSSTLEDLVKAPEHQIRAILRELCHDQDIRVRALGHFDDLLAIDTPSNTKKRKADDELCICVHCDNTFFKNDNTLRTACYYHSGELEADYDAHVWDDHDESCHGTIDSKEMRKEHPEGFTWTCCDKGGSEAGCKVGKHEADPLKSRRETGS